MVSRDSRKHKVTWLSFLLPSLQHFASTQCFRTAIPSSTIEIPQNYISRAGRLEDQPHHQDFSHIRVLRKGVTRQQKLMFKIQKFVTSAPKTVALSPAARLVVDFPSNYTFADRCWGKFRRIIRKQREETSHAQPARCMQKDALSQSLRGWSSSTWWKTADRTSEFIYEMNIWNEYMNSWVYEFMYELKCMDTEFIY